MGKIIDVRAREVLDSRGNPTVEVDVILGGGIKGRAAVPSGISKGEREALELRDGDPKRFVGKGVLKAVSSVNDIIAARLNGMESSEQALIDGAILELDGTENKSKLGANATLGASLAVARASAIEAGLSLYRYIGGMNAREMPVPLMNIVNGGAHANNNLTFQEFMIAPVGANSIAQAVRMGAEIFHKLKEGLSEKGFLTSVGDEGGYAPNLEREDQALELILKAVERAGYEPGKDVCLALDVAASEFYKSGRYRLQNGIHKSTEEMIYLYEELLERFPIISIEDGLSQSDWDGWREMTAALGHKLQIVGDDLFATNPSVIRKGIKEGVANSVLIKLNQIGTLSETLEAVEAARSAGYTTIISHRSGETEDTTIADLAVACNSGQIKTGSLSRSERVAKYNQLIRIEEELGEAAIFRGRAAIRHLR